MWLRRLHITNLKRLRSFDLDFVRADGSTRLWTVLIGRNGTGKSTVLQAAALAAAGTVGAEDLVRPIKESLPDKRLEAGRGAGGAEATIAADFVFGPVGRCAKADHPFKSEHNFTLYDDGDHLGEWIRSRLWIRSDRIVEGNAGYVEDGAGVLGQEADGEVDPTRTRDGHRTPDNDPLVEARSGRGERRPSWFVVGYGVQRDLPGSDRAIGATPSTYAIERLRPLFEARSLIGPNFLDLLEGKTLAREYAALLKRVLLKTDTLVPGITDFSLRGRGGVTSSRRMTESHRFEQTIHGHSLELPARWLSHGYQSSLSWIADLVGQIVLESGRATEPDKMEGLVLVDEVDLYLHPTWQVGVIQALRDTFPRLQFIVTTHSPILLSAFRREEVVMLDFDAEGSVERVSTPRDPRLQTGSELYENFFGIDQLYPTDLREKVDEYVAIALDPTRTPAEDDRAATLLDELRREEVDPGVAPTPAVPPRRTG